jgi:hypothetical protein
VLRVKFGRQSRIGDGEEPERRSKSKSLATSCMRKLGPVEDKLKRRVEECVKVDVDVVGN